MMEDITLLRTRQAARIAAMMLAWLLAVDWVLARGGAESAGVFQVEATLPTPAVQLGQWARTAGTSFHATTGHLPTLLGALDIPLESQLLVFSKTSLQTELIAPRMPRAIYFNDHAYVAYVAGSSQIEIMMLDPSDGVVFFTVDQARDAPNPKTEQVCQLCHDPERTGTSRLIMRSHYVDRDGNALQQPGQMSDLLFETTDQSPFERRWGGWYVTGTHGALRHMGNIRGTESVARISDPVAYAKGMDLSLGANVLSLVPRVESEPFLALDSDIVALMVFGHQVTVENAIATVRRSVRRWPGSGEPPAQEVASVAEPLARSLMFVGARALPGSIQGTTRFRHIFESAGISDRRGRSLRALDLEHRLFKYPVSYMLYTASFNSLPAPIREYVYHRIGGALNGSDPAFASFDAADRIAAAEILRDSKPDIVPFLNIR